MEKIFSDGALRWAVHALQMNLGAEKPAETWILNRNLSIDLVEIVNMEGTWTFIQAVAIIALLVKEHLFTGFIIIVEQAKDSNGKLKEDNMISPRDTHNLKYRFLPKMVIIKHGSNEMRIELGNQDKTSHYQSRTTYYSFSPHDPDTILAQLQSVAEEFAPFIEKLKKYLNVYPDAKDRHFLK